MAGDPLDGGAQRFAYHRAIAPSMIAFAVVATVELFVVHLLVSLWNGTVALLLSIVTLASLLWLVRLIHSFWRLPVLVGPDMLVMRLGNLRTVAVPRDHVAGIRSVWDAAELRAPGIVNLARIAYPNVLVDIRPPLPGRNPVHGVAHRLDDPAGFVASLKETA